MRSHLWPFIDVLREIWPGVTRKMWRPLRFLVVETAVSAPKLNRLRVRTCAATPSGVMAGRYPGDCGQSPLPV